MPKCIIDGREAEFAPGQNLIEVAKTVGVEIPYFCYHPGLSVVAQCRMCTVEIEKMPKLQTACSTAATEGMVVKTRSARAIQNQKSVMEFLLINHPLDCPICDKAGECDLQDESFAYGSPYSRYTEERRTYLDLDMGPVIKKNMNRCIHCTRCIRFGTEVAGIHEMVAVQRGNNTEITTIDGRPLETDYAGNYADVCPTGSLTLKDFRFKKRAWFLKKTSTVCEGCAKGCNMELHQDGNVIYRSLPRENMEINKYWLCDEGRFNFHYVHDQRRVLNPAIASASGLQMTDWKAGIAAAKAALAGRKVAILAGSDLTLEEAKLLLEVAPKQFGGAPVFHFGTPGIKTVLDDAPADKILKRKSKTSNLNGVEKLGIKPYAGLPAGIDAVLVVRGGRAQLPTDLDQAKSLVGIGVFNQPQVAKFAAVLPGASFAEKDGTIVNYEGREQKIKRAINPIGKSKLLPEILMMWVNQ
ncbi:MAG: 2Fe-2S iron-sulfur cluster-binding protein [Oligoflexia bacterium]|nr:2Fe-2S iron-sulfur cluster-binding protein [Oligoflexia bacterium]